MPVVHHYLNDHDDWHGLRSLQSLSLDAQGDPTDGFAADSSPTAASEQAQSQLDPSTAPLTISAAASASPLAGNRTEHKSAAVSTEHDVDATNSVDPGRGSGVDSTGADTSLVATPTDPALPNSRPSLPLALSADARMSAFGPSHLPFFFSPPASVFSSAPSTLSTIPTSLPVSSLPSESTPSSTSDSPSVSPSSEADASHKSFTGAIVGGILGGIACLTLILALAVYLCKRHRTPKADWYYVQRDEHTNDRQLPFPTCDPLTTQARSTPMEGIPLMVDPYPSTNPFAHPQDPDGPMGEPRARSGDNLVVEQVELLRESSRGSSGRTSDAN